MPIPSTLVGQKSEPHSAPIDARWTMAYAASLGDELPEYFDTTREQGVVAHPLFSVCLDWPVFLAVGTTLGAEAVTREERVRGVHATHAVINHRLIRPGDELRTTATCVGVQRTRAGAYQTVRLDTCDGQGAPVYSTWYGTVYRAVDVEGPDVAASDAPEVPAGPAADAPAIESVRIPIAAGAAHVYTEGARIWNPIHTDLAVARGAGLPGLILHGTATLAHATSSAVRLAAGGDPTRIRALGGRFSAMVAMPSQIRFEITARDPSPEGETLHFRVRNAEDALAIRDGWISVAGADRDV